MPECQSSCAAEARDASVPGRRFPLISQQSFLQPFAVGIVGDMQGEWVAVIQEMLLAGWMEAVITVRLEGRMPTARQCGGGEWRGVVGRRRSMFER